MKNLFLFSTVTSIVLISSFAQAQVITWGPATDVATAAGNSSDVSLNGSFVEAFNTLAPDRIAAATTVTVNTVDFTPLTNLFSPNNNNQGNADLSVGTNGGDADYDTILSTANLGGGTDLTVITVGGTGGLIADNDYEIQIWYVDDRPNSTDRETPVGDENGNVVNLNDQFVIGTFTSDGSVLQLTLESPGFGQAHISAYQIRDVTGDVLLGDVNLDGEVTFLDISPFIALLSTEGFQAEADIDFNEEVTFLDIAPFIALLAGQ